MKNILIADPETFTLLINKLKTSHYEVSSAASLAGCMEIITNDCPALIIFDLQYIPHWKLIREKSKAVLIATTQKLDEKTEIESLKIGVDYCIGKPFSIPVMLARISAALKRKRSVQVLEYGPIKMNLLKHTVTANGVHVELTPIPFNMLKKFLLSPEAALSRQILINDDLDESSLRSVDVNIKFLRKSLGKYSQIIQTVPSIGYRLFLEKT